MQCGLSSGKQKFTVILVWWSSMQVTRGTWCMHKESVPGFLSSTTPQEPGNEATLVPYLAVAKADTPELCEFAPTD